LGEIKKIGKKYGDSDFFPKGNGKGKRRIPRHHNKVIGGKVNRKNGHGQRRDL